MLKRSSKLVSKVLMLVMCTSLVSTAIAFSGVTNVVYASASTVSAESDFEFDSTTGAITGYKGSATTLIIPSEISGVKVKIIAEDAFYKCSSLASITIPNSVTSIGKGAFIGCSKLTRITIPSSVKSIG